MNNSQESLNLLSAPIDPNAIQKTKGSETNKPYDTTGYGYQYCVNRFNDVLGLDGWGFVWEIIRENQGTFTSGKPFFDVTVKVNIWIGSPSNTRSCVGSHISTVYGDAVKGALTNGFKKTAAFWGVGRQAYEGSLDDDASFPAEMGSEDGTPEPSPEYDSPPVGPLLPSPPPTTAPLQGKRQVKNPEEPITEAQVKGIFYRIKKLGYTDSQTQHQYVASLCGMTSLDSMNSLNKGQASMVIDHLQQQLVKKGLA